MMNNTVVFGLSALIIHAIFVFCVYALFRGIFGLLRAAASMFMPLRGISYAGRLAFESVIWAVLGTAGIAGCIKALVVSAQLFGVVA